MSLERAHLSVRPWLPAHILALIEQPERFEQLVGVPAAAGLREMFMSEGSPHCSLPRFAFPATPTRGAMGFSWCIARHAR